QMSTGSASLGSAAIKDYHFADLADFIARIPGLSQAEVNSYLTVDGSVYRLELEGRVGRIKRRATAIIQRGKASKKTTGTSAGNSSIVILRWQEET
ncbi:MAG: hypothetical protein RSD41_05205, partial [Kiritimatiellia bacterium]